MEPEKKPLDQEPLVFGRDSFDDARAKRPHSINPCVNEYGAGPIGTMCNTCAFLRSDAGSYRCALRKRRARHGRFWPACLQYKAE